MERRQFLQATMAGSWTAQTHQQPRYRAVIIGHTGGGNFGHDWDIAWKGVPAVEVTAVADPVESGRRKAQARSGAPRAYASYREMIDREKPQIVTIAPRMLDERVPMVQAAAQAGAHILMEKPFAKNLEEAAQILAAVEKAGVRMQVGHSARVAQVTPESRRLLRDGRIGDLLEIRGRGKEDRRAGGEDMIVLGTHVFDLMRYFAGDPLWVFANITDGGRQLKPEGMREGTEKIGKIGGDDIAAMFQFPGGVRGYFASKRSRDRTGRRFGVTLYGSGGLLYVPLNDVPSAEPHLLRARAWAPENAETWERVPYPPGAAPADRQAINRLMALDLLEAIEANRPPACDARDGYWTIAMVEAVYRSHFAGQPVSFPLQPA